MYCMQWAIIIAYIIIDSLTKKGYMFIKLIQLLAGKNQKAIIPFII